MELSTTAIPGIAYVPKSLYADDPAHIVQLQLLCAYDFDSATSEVDVRIQNDNGDVTAVGTGDFCRS